MMYNLNDINYISVKNRFWNNLLDKDQGIENILMFSYSITKINNFHLLYMHYSYHQFSNMLCIYHHNVHKL